MSTKRVCSIKHWSTLYNAVKTIKQFTKRSLVATRNNTNIHGSQHGNVTVPLQPK